MEITENLRDAAYIVIGMGVIGVQRAQVRRNELNKQIAEAVKQAESLVAPVRSRLEAQLDAVSELLPAPAKDLVAQARKAGLDLRTRVAA